MTIEPEAPFTEPWQAQAFAMAVALHERGAFTWSEWAEHLGARIASAGPDDDGSRYYEHWLAALLDLLDGKGIVRRELVTTHAGAWDRAARATPHGRPIEPPPVPPG